MSVGDGSVAVKAREPQIAEQCNSLEKSVEFLRAAVDNLESRLERVLCGSTDTDSKAGVPEEILFPLADWLRETERKIEVLANRIASLTNRIEL